MGYDLTLSGLLRKRAEMAGEVEALQAKLGALIADLSHVDATIRVFRPDIDLADLPEKLAPAPFTGFRGEIQRFLLDELRKTNAPLSTFDLAEAVMRKRGLDPCRQGCVPADRKAHRLRAGEAAEAGEGDECPGAPPGGNGMEAC